MDLTKSFVEFLKDVLINESKKYETSLLAISYETIADAKRLSGIRDTFIGVSDSLDNVLKDFYMKYDQKPTSPVKGAKAVAGE